MGKRAGKRYINEINLNMDPVYVENSMQEYLRQNNFKYVNEKGENFYKTSGVLRCLKYWYNNGVLHIEAWIGKIGKELDISDRKIYGAAYKIPYYNSVLSLLGAFEQDRQLHQSLGAQNLGAQNLGAQNLGTQNLGSKSFGTQNSSAQNFGTQNLGTQNLSAQNYGQVNTQPYGANNQSYGQINTQPYGANNQNYGQVNTQPYGANNQSYGQINTQPYGANNQNYGQVNPQPYGVNNQSYGQVNTQPYGVNNQSYGQIYSQPYGVNNQTNSAISQEINKANDRNAVIAFWLSIAALIFVFASKLSLLVNVGSYYLAIIYGLKSRKRGMAMAAIIINSFATGIAILLILGSVFFN